MIPTPHAEFDGYTWFYNCGGIWDVPDLEYDAHMDCLINVLGIDERSTSVVRTGKFSTVLPWFNLDEWTYLVGIPEVQLLTSDIARKLTGFMSKVFFETLEDTGSLFLVCVAEQRWECFPERHPLMKHIAPGLEHLPTNSDKWLTFEKNPGLNVHPRNRENLETRINSKDSAH